jgi:hypothetical protein
VYYYPVPTYYYYPYPVAYSSPSPVYGEATSLYSNISLPPAGSASSSNYGNLAQESLPAPQPDTEEAKVSKLLTAIGVPNDNGHLRWPVGLKDLGGPDSGHEADELRERLRRALPGGGRTGGSSSAEPEAFSGNNRRPP